MLVGPFEQIVGVGTAGQWTQIQLTPSGPRSEDSLSGRRTHTSDTGYVRIYSLIGGLPGIPGRYYPQTGVLCLSWSEPPSGPARSLSHARDASRRHQDMNAPGWVPSLGACRGT